MSVCSRLFRILGYVQTNVKRRIGQRQQGRKESESAHGGLLIKVVKPTLESRRFGGRTLDTVCHVMQ